MTGIEIIWRVISWDGEGTNRENDAGIKKHNYQVQNRQGDVKNSIGNGEAKEFISMTHGDELSEVGSSGGKRGTGWMEAKGENWDNCNNIINEYT